jgi:hypothetical protein
VDPTIVSAFIGGAFALLGVAVGSVFSHRQTMQALREQRAYAEAVRKSELSREDHREFHPLSDEAKIVVGNMMGKGGRSLDLNAIADSVRLSQHAQLGRERVSEITADTFYCFPRGTLVMLWDESFRAVEELRENELIRVHRTHSYTEGESPVARVAIGPGKQLLIINETISITPEQEILTTGGYRAAIALRLGDQLVSDARRAVDITSLKLDVIDENVYGVILHEDAGYYIKSTEMNTAFIVREAATSKGLGRPRDFGEWIVTPEGALSYNKEQEVLREGAASPSTDDS